MIFSVVSVCVLCMWVSIEAKCVGVWGLLEFYLRLILSHQM